MITYARLIEATSAGPSSSQTKLELTTLKHFMKVLELRPDDDATALLEPEYVRALATYSEHLTAASFSYGTQGNRRSALKRLRTRCLDLVEEDAPIPAQQVHPYWREVENILKEGRLAKSKRKYYENVLNNEAKRLPKTVRHATKVAQGLGVPAERLLQHLQFEDLGQLFDLRNPAYCWNETVKELNKLTYVLGELPSAVGDVLRTFLYWRKATSPAKLPLQHLDHTVHVIKRVRGWTYSEGQSEDVPPESELKFVKCLKSFYGFATLPKDATEARERGFADPEDARLWGLGIPVEKLRLAHFLSGENLSAYCDFRVRRNGRFDSGDLKDLRQHVRVLIGSSNAYARNAQTILHSDFSDVLGEGVLNTPEAWDTWCGEQCTILNEKIESLTKARSGRNTFKQGRSIEDNLRFLLEMNRPMEEVVWPTILYLEEKRPCKDANLNRRFIYESKLFTLTSLASEPFRRRNWLEMQWKKHLFLKNGIWYISLKQGVFKNRRFLQNDYHSRIEDAAQPLFTSYYEIWKERWGYDPLAGEVPKRVSYVHACKSPDEISCSSLFPKRLSVLETLWNLTVGPHAFRHIFATDWLKRHPDDFFTVAGKLNDSIAVVLRDYGHLRSSDHSSRINNANRGLLDVAQKHLLAAQGALNRRGTARGGSPDRARP